MKKVNYNGDIKPIEFIEARKDYLEELDKLMVLEYSVKKKKKELLKNMKEWDKKLLLI